MARLANFELIKINPFALVSISVCVLIPSLFLFMVHSNIRASPPTSLLKSIGHRSIPYNPKEETSPRVGRFPTAYHSDPRYPLLPAHLSAASLGSLALGVPLSYNRNTSPLL